MTHLKDHVPRLPTGKTTISKDELRDMVLSRQNDIKRHTSEFVNIHNSQGIIVAIDWLDRIAKSYYPREVIPYLYKYVNMVVGNASFTISPKL